MYRLLGLSLPAAAVVVAEPERVCADWDQPVGRSRKLTVGAALRMTLRWPRRNTGDAELGEDVGVPTSVAWDDVQEMLGVLEGLVGQSTNELARAVRGQVVGVDGSLRSRCWSTGTAASSASAATVQAVARTCSASLRPGWPCCWTATME